MIKGYIVRLPVGYWNANTSSQFIDCEAQIFSLCLEHYLSSRVCFLSLCMVGIQLKE